jgi:hypothetical protein
MLCSTETNFPFLKPKYVCILPILGFPQIFQARIFSQNHFQRPGEYSISQFTYIHYFPQQHISRTDRSVAQKTERFNLDRELSGDWKARYALKRVELIISKFLIR